MPEDTLPDTDHQSIIDSVLAARSKRNISVHREYDGVPVEFRFQPSMTIPALRIVSTVGKLAEADRPDIMEQLRLLMDFLDVTAEPETGRLIGSLLEAGAIDINEVAFLQQEVVTQIAARPTMRSSSSATGSDGTGESSTDSADSEASTLPTSHSIAF